MENVAAKTNESRVFLINIPDLEGVFEFDEL
jgi:hypothetical protein